MVAAASATDRDGRRLGRYRLRWQVASGGMGAVWLAQLEGPHGFGKWVAIKIMHAHLATDRRVVDMFLDEARIAARIHHNHVCAVLDFGEEGGEPFIVMEHLHGESLASVLEHAWGGDRPSGMPWWLAARVVADAARGLHAAHETCDESGAPAGIVHRDVSPQNVFVQYEGAAKVVDFGVARARGRITTTKSGELKGKLAYMAPEQLRRGEIDRRTDVWALGVVLWESVAGQRLFHADNEGELVLAILQERIPKLSSVRKECPTYLEALVANVLERQAARRPSSAAEVADALDRCLFHLGEPAGHPQVAAWMNEQFGDRREARERILRRPSGALELPEPFRVEHDVQSSLRSRAPDERPAPDDTVDPEPLEGAPTVAVARPTSTSARASHTEPDPPPYPPTVISKVERARRDRRLVLVLGLGALGALGALLALGGATAWLSLRDTPQDALARSGTPSSVTRATRSSPAPAAPPGRSKAPLAPTPTGPAAPSVSGSSAPATPVAAPSASRARAVTAREARVGAEARTANGQVNLLAFPAAEVSWRGRRMGRTPVALRMPAGRQRLVLRTLRGGRTQTITVEVRPGRTTRRAVRFE